MYRVCLRTTMTKKKNVHSDVQNLRFLEKKSYKYTFFVYLYEKKIYRYLPL